MLFVLHIRKKCINLQYYKIMTNTHLQRKWRKFRLKTNYL